MSKILIEQDIIDAAISDFDAIQVAAGIPDGTQTSQYADYIRQLGAGDVAPAPEDVYAVTRPADWLTMPDVSENEMYLLLHLRKPDENYIAFTVTCTGSYTVEYGTVSGGSFVAAGNGTVSSGTKYERTFLYGDWADETSTGSRQVMLRITGTDIKTFAPGYHSGRNYTSFYSWNIVEFKGNLPSCTSCLVGGATSSQTTALQYLRYFSLEGTNSITDGANMFRNCRSLLAVLALDPSKMSSGNYMFYYAVSLVALPETLDFSSVTTANYMFQYAAAIMDLSMYSFDSLTTANYMLAACAALRFPPVLESGKITSISGIISTAYSLEYFIIDISSVTTALSIFSGNYNLSYVVFLGTATAFPAAFSLQYASMDETGGILFFNSLPKITTTRAITISGTPLTASANVETIAAIAEGKGWTVTR